MYVCVCVCERVNVDGTRKESHLDVFSVELFVQWEALDSPLVTGVEGAQLHPLVGGVPEREGGGETGSSTGTVCMCVCVCTCH